MIEMLEGVPGSGKSYHAVAEKFLAWVRGNRKIYIFVDGIYLDRLAAFEGRTVAELERQIVVWTTAEEVRAGLLDVTPGSAIIIDEAQTVFRSKEKVAPELLRMLETHRHLGLDLVMMCQQHGQMTLGVLRLVEVTTRFRRLDRFGLKNRYQGQVRGNPEETEVIRMFTGRYKPDVYAYYSSYANAAIRETARGGSIMKSPMVILGLAGLIGAGLWFSSGRWLSQPPDVQARESKALVLPAPSVDLPPIPQSAPVLVRVVRVQGGMWTDGVWTYVTQDGRLLTHEQIEHESGTIVNARMDRGVRVLYGPGVIWGGEKATTDYRTVNVFPEDRPVSPPASVEQAYISPNGVDLLKSPPDLR